MQSRFQFTFAIGVVAALTLGASSAAAQQPTTGTGSTGSTGSTMGTTGVQRDSATGTVSRDTSGLTRPTTPGNTFDTTAVPVGTRSGGSLGGTGTGPGTTGPGATTGSGTGASLAPSSTTSGSSGSSSSYGPASTSGSGAPTSGAPAAPPRSNRVRKDGTTTSSSGGEVAPEMSAPPAPAPAPMPAPAPQPAPAPEAAPAPAASTDSGTAATTGTTITSSTSGGEVEAQPAMSGPKFGNGFYWGLHAGANFPQNEINTFYEAGFSGGAMLGWDPETSPLGLRLNLTYNRLNGQDLVDQQVGNTTYTGEYSPSDLYSAFADAKLRIPFGRFLGATSGLYAVGGAGVTYFRNYQTFSNVTGTPSGSSVTNTFNSEDVTRFAINGGGGLSWGLGRTSLFVEGRYVRVFTPGQDTDWVPVSVGLTFR